MNFIVGKNYGGKTISCSFPSDSRSYIEEVLKNSPDADEQGVSIVEFNSNYIRVSREGNMGTIYYYIILECSSGDNIEIYSASEYTGSAGGDPHFSVSVNLQSFVIPENDGIVTKVNSHASPIFQYMSCILGESLFFVGKSYGRIECRFPEDITNEIRNAAGEEATSDNNIITFSDGSYIQASTFLYNHGMEYFVYFNDETNSKFETLYYKGVASDALGGNSQSSVQSFRIPNNVTVTAVNELSWNITQYMSEFIPSFIGYKNNGTISNASIGFKSKHPLPVKIKNSNNLYIYNAKDLENAINNANSSTSENKKYYLMNSIDISQVDSFPSFTDFKGHFYGNGFTVTMPPCAETAGNLPCFYLFIKNNGIIEDLIVTGGAVNLTSTSKTSYLGGICSINYGRIIRCFNNDRQLYSSASALYVGGIAGMNESSGEIIKCLNKTTNIGFDNTTATGGIVGRNFGLVQGCGNESGTTVCGTNAGGIVGYSLAGSVVNNCYSLGQFSGTYIGGIVGYSYKGEINNCFAVSVDGSKLSGTYHGGICGYNNYGTYSNNYYCTESFSKASSEYNSSTAVNSTGLTSFEMRDGWMYDMIDPLEKRLGNNFIHMSGYNEDYPIQTWQKAGRISDNEFPGVTTNIWMEYIDENSREITLNFENTNLGGKLEKLEISISRANCSGNIITKVHNKTILDPSTLEQLHFQDAYEMLMGEKTGSYGMEDGYYLGHVEATWTTISGKKTTKTLDVFPYNLSKAIIYSSTEALAYCKNTLGYGNTCSIVQESQEIMDTYEYPIEYMISYSAGAHTEFKTLFCTGQTCDERSEIKDMYSDAIAARCFSPEMNKRQNGYCYDYNFSNTSITGAGTMSISNREYKIVNSGMTVMGDGTCFFGPITTEHSGGVACLLEGSEILSSNNELIPIEQLKIGDKVKSYNKEKNKIEDKEIFDIYSHKTLRVYEITLENDSKIYATNTHRFYTKEKGIVNVMNLELQNTLITEDNKELKVVKTKIVPTDKKLVYEIWTRDNGNYFTGKDKILSYCEDYEKVKEIKGGTNNE